MSHSSHASGPQPQWPFPEKKVPVEDTVQLSEQPFSLHHSFYEPDDTVIFWSVHWEIDLSSAQLVSSLSQKLTSKLT